MDNVVSEETLLAAIVTLEAVAEDRGHILLLEKDDRDRLLRAVGRISDPGKAGRRQTARAKKLRQREDLEKQKLRDKALLDSTGIRTSVHGNLRTSEGIPKGISPQPLLDAAELEQIHNPAAAVRSEAANASEADTNAENKEPAKASDKTELEEARNCYICKNDFRTLHTFYDSLCPECSDFNWLKREQTADLTGRYALLTGGRVKIGYHVGLKLLRAGAHLIVTTRFPRDAARRYAEEPDHEQWMDRLTLHGIDLRDTGSVMTFTDHLSKTLPQLDFIINNACQTVRRPPQYYAHLIEGEQSPLESLPADAVRLLADASVSSATDKSNDVEITNPTTPVGNTIRSAELSQIPLTEEDKVVESRLFPRGVYDWDEQQVDMRKMNSWRLRLAEVAPVELLEVHLVNAIAPFILNGQLKPLMTRTANRDKHIVNVSAMEGVFYRAFKRDTHPHTNMAKASLNMMTRTSAADYVKDGIHMNSVDTGWINDEDPLEIAERKKDEFGFHPPLDYEDAAARICDPIFDGLNTNEHVWGVFLKDYKVSNW
jgi:NAD(P)-dependent dehydrogenase (short-subunit alcohol dehydrogenase family)